MRTGLSQKSDARWLKSPAMLSATNAVKLKAETMQKRPGFAALNINSTQLPLGTQKYRMDVGRRLAARQGVLTMFADPVGLVTGELYPTMIWQHDEQLGTPQPYDLVPETAVAPGIQVAAYEQSMPEMDEIIVNGMRVTVFLVDLTGAGQPTPYYCIQDAATNEYIATPQPAVSAGNYASPKLCTATLSGITYAVLCYIDAAQTTIFATSLSLANPTGNWCAPQSLVTSGLGTLIFDSSNVVGDATSFVLAYALNTSGVGVSCAIRVARCNLASNSLPQVNLTGTISDAQYNTDSNPALDGICVRGDNNGGYVWIGYAYRHGGVGRRVRAAAQTYPTVTGVFAAPFAVESTGDTQNVGLMDIELVGNYTSTNQGLLLDVHCIAWSPKSQLMNGGSQTVTQFIKTAHVNKNQGLISNQPRETFNLTLASRFITVNDRAYVGAYINSPVQGGYCLLAVDYWTDSDTSTPYPMRYVACIAPRLASGPPGTSGAFATHAVLPHLAHNPSAPGGTVLEWCVSQNKTQTINAPTVYQIDFNAPKNYAAAELGGNLAYACGVPSGFDGEKSFELGFPYRPEQLSTSVAASAQANGNITNGTYSYVAIYEQRDKYGQVHRSGRSPAVSATVVVNGAGPNAQVAVTIPTMSISGRQRPSPTTAGTSDPIGQYPAPAPVVIRVYRTTAGGSVYYSCDTTDQVSSTAVAQFNSLSVGNITLTDKIADAQLQSNPLLYGDGGLGINGSSLDNLCAPSFQHIITHKNRLWGVDGSNIWYSKAFTTGEGSAFNESFAFSVDDGSGPVTALASLDDKLIIFKRTGVYYVTGDGPTDGNGQNDFSPPQKITSSVGCKDWRCVMTRSAGVMFWSDRGQYILTRDLQVTPLPAVEDAITANPVPTSAVIHPTTSRLVWTANTDDTSSPRSGIGISYDDVLDSWTTWQGIPSNAAEGAVSAAVAGASVAGVITPTYHWQRANGTIMRELGAGAASFEDAGQFVTSTYRTPWIVGSDIQAFARFRRLFVAFQMPDRCGIKVYAAWDFNETDSLIGSFTSTQILAFASPLPQIRVPLPRHRAESVRFTIQDTFDAAGATGQGIVLLGLTLEVGLYTNQRGVRLPAAQAT